MQSSVYATCTDWNFFRGIPYLLQRGVDSLSHTAQCQWAASVDLLPCCKKSYSCGEAHFRSGLFVTQYRICVHTLDCHLHAAKKQQARRSSTRGKLESEKVGLPWAQCVNQSMQDCVYPGPDLGFWRVLMTHVLTKFMQGILSNTQIT